MSDAICRAFSDAISFVSSNPFILNILVHVASSATYDAGKKIIGHLYVRFRDKPGAFSSEQVEEMKLRLERCLESVRAGSTAFTLTTAFQEDFNQFMFPDREIPASQLGDFSEYIAERLFCGVTFKSMLIEIGYLESNVEYLYKIGGQIRRSPYYFDIMAKYPTPYIYNLLVARVIDSRVHIPIESIQSIPAMIDDINKANPKARFRDHDVFVIIHSGNVTTELSSTIKDILARHQRKWPSYPRFLYLEKNELSQLIDLPPKNRVDILNGKIRDIRIDRGI